MKDDFPESRQRSRQSQLIYLLALRIVTAPNREEKQKGAHLRICAEEEDELRTSFLEEEEEAENDRGTLGDFEGGRMEQWGALVKFNLSEKHKVFAHSIISKVSRTNDQKPHV